MIMLLHVSIYRHFVLVKIHIATKGVNSTHCKVVGVTETLHKVYVQYIE